MLLGSGSGLLLIRKRNMQNIGTKNRPSYRNFWFGPRPVSVIFWSDPLLRVILNGHFKALTNEPTINKKLLNMNNFISGVIVQLLYLEGYEYMSIKWAYRVPLVVSCIFSKKVLKLLTKYVSYLKMTLIHGNSIFNGECMF